MTAQDDILFCYSCGELDPQYTRIGYSRVCLCGRPTVVTLTEAIDYLNQRYVYYGDVVIKEDMLDEEYDRPDLDFDEYVQDLEGEEE